MKIYQTKAKKIVGTSYREVHKKALLFHRAITQKTKRRPYVRSAYFKKEKIFLELFWNHLWDKQNWQDRMRRLRFYPSAIDLIQSSHLEPCLKENPNKSNEFLYRFAGITKEKELFYIQIKENKKTKQKSLISVFPISKYLKKTSR